MGQPLKVLLLEDNAIDAELIRYALEESGFEPEIQRAVSREEYSTALSPELDVVLMDLNLPQFSGAEALEMVRERRLDVPCLLISGIRNEELAMQSMEWDVVGYVAKDHLERLGPAIRAALETRRLAREKR